MEVYIVATAEFMDTLWIAEEINCLAFQELLSILEITTSKEQAASGFQFHISLCDYGRQHFILPLERPVRCVAGLVKRARGAMIDVPCWLWPVSLQGKLELT
uniref:Uncharacterized protein n=1 Tax=Arundo donax TaxID=35708 RepID=A0A0A9ET18_ARUDO